MFWYQFISEIDKKYVGAVETLLVNLLRDEDSNSQYFQCMFGKLSNQFLVSLDNLSRFKNFFNRATSLAKAINPLYIQNTERINIFFRCVKPIEIPKPSDYSLTLLNSIIDLVNEKPIFVVFESVFFIALFYLPLFKYVNLSATEIFELYFNKAAD